MGIAAAIENSARGRFWQWRLLVLVWIVYIAWRHLTNAEYTSPFEPLNVVFHEIGHPLFRPLGELMNVAGGTILQLLLPFAALIILLKQSEFFAVPICGAWLADNLYGVARYIADARVQAREYVTLGANTGEPVEATHDWEFLLGRLNLLEEDTVIGARVRILATAVMWVSIALGVAITWLMFKGSSKVNE